MRRAARSTNDPREVVLGVDDAGAAVVGFGVVGAGVGAGVIAAVVGAGVAFLNWK